MEVVWLKKDSRLRDHGPLNSVLNRNDKRSSRFALLYLYEPSQLEHHSAHGSHVAFHNEALSELEADLCQLRRGDDQESLLTIFISEAVAALEHLHRSTHGPIKRLLSHLETGHQASYDRDKAVKRWCNTNCVEWVEWNQTGVIRGLDSRTDIEAKPFAARWGEFMAQKQHPDLRAAPLRDLAGARLREALLPGSVFAGTVGGVVRPSDARLGMHHPEDRPSRQRGGESEAWKLLDSFLSTRGFGYSDGISSPEKAGSSCSRLSPYITHGQISTRSITQALAARQAQARRDKKEKGWLKPLAAFAGRLRWRSHFIQKAPPFMIPAQSLL